MVITALDTSFNAVAVIEAYRSFIWTERYEDIGDFELYVPASAPYLDKLRNDFYIMCSESPIREARIDEDPGGLQTSKLIKLMIIEKIEYKTDLEDGNSVLISGRSLESILERRIVWKEDGSITEINRDAIYKSGAYLNPEWEGDTTSSIPIEHAIGYLIHLNIAYGASANRKIENFLMYYNVDDELHPDTRIREASIRPCSYRGNTLYDVIRDICKQCEVSFNVRWNSSPNSQGYECFVLYLYKGNSHLSSQSANGYVCFSTEFDNLLSSDNSLDMSTYKTMAYYLGKGEQWSVKSYVNTELCSTGWIRVYNNALYACKQDFKDHDVPIPRPDDKTPPNDPDNWALVTDWNHTTAYTAGSYVTYYATYDIEIYRINHDIARYSTSTTYSAGSVVMGGSGSESWMYVSLQDDNLNNPLTDSSYWYRCANEDECFNAQDWEQVQSVQKENYDISGDIQNNSTSGLDRRELFVDATNVPASYTYYPDGATEKTYILDKGVYEATLRDKALSELTIPANRPTKFFDCEIETKVSFKFGKDYNIGDIIEVKDTYGFVDSVVVDSYVISHDEAGVISAYPTFDAVESSSIVTKYLTVDMALSTGTFLLKIPESTRFTDKQVIATAKNTTTNTTYYLMSFVKKIKCDSTFSTGQTDREMHIVAWTTDQTVYTDGRYQPEDQALTVGPAIVGTPMFYINIEGGITLPGVLNPSWLPPIDINLGDVLSVNEDAGQYKNILIANL